MRKRAVLRPPQFRLSEEPRKLIVVKEEGPAKGVRVIKYSCEKGKGRFGKRATPISSEYERHIEDSSNDSGFECDWDSQSQSQFAWCYSSSSNTANSSSSSHLNSSNGGLEDSSNHSTHSAPAGFSIPKFAGSYVDVSCSSNGAASGKRLSNLGHAQEHVASASMVAATTGYSSSLREEDINSNDGSRSGTDSGVQFPPSRIGGKLSMSPGKTVRMPGRGGESMASTSGTSVPVPVSAPSPVKRPRLCFSPPTGADTKSTAGLKLRNQNGVHHVRSSVGKRLPPGTTPSLTSPLTATSRDGRVQLQIISQPEEQHRARYQTEGSRGAIKDRKCNGFPTVKLIGYDKPATLQIFIGTDQGKVSPHMFYQACKVTGKSSTPCIEKTVEGTVVIEIEFEPSKDMVISCDCVGILKSRNVDVEQRFPFHHASATQSRKKSTKCRMVFRTTIINSMGQEETLQVASLPILCTQPPGQPEICKQSLNECPASGGKEIFIIGKNFLKDASVVIQEERGGDIVWEAKVVPLKDYLQQTHLICVLPNYKDENITSPVDCRIAIWSGGKLSEPHRLTYVPNISAAANPAALGLVNSIPDSPSRTSLGSVQHSLTMSPVSGPECSVPVEMQVGAAAGATVMSPEHIVGSSLVSPAQVSVSCHISPSSSMDSPVLASQMCSPVDQSLNGHMIPQHTITNTTSGPITAPISFESTMMSSLPTTQSSFTTTVDELKTLLEQSAHQDQQQKQQQQQIVDTSVSPGGVSIKQEVMLSPSSIIDTTTTTASMSPNGEMVPVMSTMPYQDESSMTAPTTTSPVATTANFSSAAPRYPVDPILSSVSIPQLMNSPTNLSPMNSLVNENSQHSLMQPMTMASSTTVTTGPTTMEGLVGGSGVAVPMSIAQSNMVPCMEPMMKGEATTACRVTGTTSVEPQQTTATSTTAGGSVVFINSELQGTLANALTQMSDNELINYINPSCFDQGAF